MYFFAEPSPSAADVSPAAGWSWATLYWPEVHPVKSELPCEVVLVAFVRRGQCRDVAVEEGVNPRRQRTELQIGDRRFQVVLRCGRAFACFRSSRRPCGRRGRSETSREARGLVLAGHAAAIHLDVVLHRQKHQKGFA